MPRVETPELLQDIPENNDEMELTITSSDMATETYKKVLELSSDQLVCFNVISNIGAHQGKGLSRFR